MGPCLSWTDADVVAAAFALRSCRPPTWLRCAVLLFTTSVLPSVNMVMDFHAGCSSCEVCGLLGGRWDAASRTLTIQRAFPVRELTQRQQHINVEMDPEDTVLVGGRPRAEGGGPRAEG